MSLKRTAILALAALAFAAVFMAVLMAQKNRPAPPRPAPAAMSPIEGKLDIQAIDDIRVRGRKVLLCGVAYTKPPSMRTLVTEAARREFQGKTITCKPVGSGTPCDGKVAPKFGDVLIMQCLTADGVDLAAAFSERGFVCDLPAHSGGRYTACPKP